MKLLTFVAGSQPRFGAKLGDRIIDLNAAYAAFLVAKGKTSPYKFGATAIPSDLQTFLESGHSGFQLAIDVLAFVAGGLQAGTHLLGPEGQRVIYNKDEAILKAPLARSQKLIGIGLNYYDLCEELRSDPPSSIVTFAMFANAIIGPGEHIIIPKTSKQVGWEAELVIVIGQRAKHVSLEQAFDYIAGYTCGNDVTVRDHQVADPQLTRGKSGDTHAPIGPWIVTKEEIPDPQSLDIELRVNDVVKQSSSTRNCIFKIPEIIAFISSFFALEPGDLIFTGTPAGLGFYRKPPEWLKPGDRVDITIEKIGTLTNYCSAE